jgi:hypothetical protein
MSTILQSPSYIVGPDGQPTAVLLDWTTWRSLVEQLEDHQDLAILRDAQADLQKLARHERPSGWKSWEEFEAELDSQEATGELPA